MKSTLLNFGKFSFDILIFVLLEGRFLIVSFVKMIFSMKNLKESQKKLRGKLVLITGSGSGLGREIAMNLADFGCKIAVVDINENAAKKVAAEINQKGIKAISFKADISKKSEVEKLKEDVTKQLGTVDIVVCNAGLIPDQAEDEVDDDFLRKMIDVNIYGTILVRI